jgi:hypothetical protein
MSISSGTQFEGHKRKNVALTNGKAMCVICSESAVREHCYVTKFHNVVRGHQKRCGSYNEINNFGVTEHITARSLLPMSVPLAGRAGGRNHCCNVKH